MGDRRTLLQEGVMGTLETDTVGRENTRSNYVLIHLRLSVCTNILEPALICVLRAAV